MDNAPTIVNANLPALAQPGELCVEQVIAQAEKIQKVMQAVMKRDTHYGIIPGTPKPTLLKAGAEKLCLVFRLDPQYAITKERYSVGGGEHIGIASTCTLYYIPNGARVGSGMGSCSTEESKYAYRKGSRVCPTCGEPAIRKSKQEWGGGWYCSTKDDGCGAKFSAADPAIVEQETGRIANPDLADQYNTILKMANKRSLVAAVLNVLAASDIFTQDVEDLQRKRAATDGDSKRQTAGDPATPEQRKALKDAASKKLGADAGAWLGPKLPGVGQAKWSKLTFGTYTAVMKELLELPEAPDPNRGEHSQNSDEPEHQEDIEF